MIQFRIVLWGKAQGWNREKHKLTGIHYIKNMNKKAMQNPMMAICHESRLQSIYFSAPESPPPPVKKWGYVMNRGYEFTDANYLKGQQTSAMRETQH